jgi:hypothetical protein
MGLRVRHPCDGHLQYPGECRPVGLRKLMEAAARVPGGCRYDITHCGTSHGIILVRVVARLQRQSLARLSPEHGEVIDLVYFHGKSVKEIAEIVAIAEATVKTRMFYARRKLADFVATAYAWYVCPLFADTEIKRPGQNRGCAPLVRQP